MIETLGLSNVKAFRQAELPLGKLTLLTGLNGSGKSTALQALGALRQSFDAGALDSDGLLLNGNYVEWGTGQDVLHEDYAEGPGGVPEIAITIDSEVGSAGWTFKYEKSADLLRFSPKHLAAGPGEDFLRQRFQYIRADRVVPAVQYRRSHDHVVRHRSLGARGEFAVDYLREFGDTRVGEVLRHDDSEHSSLLDQCAAWLAEFCPGINLSAVELEGTDLVRLSYAFYGTAGLASSNNYRPTNVGFGVTYVLPVLLACLVAQDQSLVLLENPEAHLHPRGQGLMGALCARAAAAGGQILVESHSDHVLNGVRLAVKSGVLRGEDVSILYFSRDENGVTIEQPIVSDDGMLSSWPRGFFDEWEEAIERLLD